MSERDGSGLMRWAGGTVAVLAVVYLGLFVVAWMDEEVFETYWLEAYLPEAMYHGYGVLMMPVAWLMELIFG